MKMSDIRLLVTDKAKYIAAKRIEKIRLAISTAATLWRNQLRRELSRPYPGGKNSTGTPYMRSGMLRKSVPRFSVTTRQTFLGNKYDTGQTVIVVKRIGARPAWDTYGEELNRWDIQPTNLTGWQDRAYEALNKRIDKHLGFTKTYFRF